MDITFGDKKLRKYANNDALAKKKLGQRRAQLYKQRLDDLVDAETLENVKYLPGNYHELKGDRKGQWACNLDHPYRLIFEPQDNPIPENESGQYVWFEIKGIENIPSTSRIIAPTHQSMLDGFLIEATLPYGVLKNTFFLAFKQVFGTLFFNPIAKHGQTILIDANYKLKESMQNAALPLKKKKNLVIFPEGARTRDRKLLEFRPFFAMLSKTYNVPIIPVIIERLFCFWDCLISCLIS